MTSKRAGAAGTSNFGMESLNSTLQISNLASKREPLESSQLANLPLRQPPKQAEKKYIGGDYSPISSQSHYSMLRKENNPVTAPDNNSHEYSSRSAAHHDQSEPRSSRLSG